LVLDIVIVNYRSTDHLLHCLGSVYNSLQGLPAHIFVQDNASEDGVDRVVSMFPEVRLSKNDRNLGFARAVNNGLRQGSGPYILLLNPDSLVGDGLFEATLKYMQKNPQVGILGPKILNADGSTQGSARSFPDAFTGLFGRSSVLSRLFPRNPLSRRYMLTTASDGITPMHVDWVSGACMVVRRKAFEAVGPMDERFFMYWEDADWCRRMWRKGWKVVYFPASKVIHYAGRSSSEKPVRSAYEFHKSSFKLFNKHARFTYRLMSPLVALGLAMRFCLVVTVSGLRRLVRDKDQEGIKHACKHAG
jgi:hypothetical protein